MSHNNNRKSSPQGGRASNKRNGSNKGPKVHHKNYWIFSPKIGMYDGRLTGKIRSESKSLSVPPFYEQRLVFQPEIPNEVASNLDSELTPYQKHLARAERGECGFPVNYLKKRGQWITLTKEERDGGLKLHYTSEEMGEFRKAREDSL